MAQRKWALGSQQVSAVHRLHLLLGRGFKVPLHAYVPLSKEAIRQHEERATNNARAGNDDPGRAVQGRERAVVVHLNKKKWTGQ